MKFEAEQIPHDKLPSPVGWRILIGPIKIEDTSAGGIMLPGETVKGMEYFRNVAKVLAVGPGCYQHPKFQGGVPLEQHSPEPWCKVGDVIQYNSFTGAEIVITHEDEEHKVRFINDDEVISVINDLSVLNVL